MSDPTAAAPTAAAAATGNSSGLDPDPKLSAELNQARACLYRLVASRRAQLSSAAQLRAYMPAKYLALAEGVSGGLLPFAQLVLPEHLGALSHAGRELLWLRAAMSQEALVRAALDLPPLAGAAGAATGGALLPGACVH